MRTALTKLFAPLVAATLVACGSSRPSCASPAVNTGQLNQIKAAQFSGPATGYLFLTNPVDATGNPSSTGTDANSVKDEAFYALPNLPSATSLLENSFMHVRLASTTESTAGLAHATNGQFKFALTDVAYSQTDAYFGINSEELYAEALGYHAQDSRPLYAFVRANIGVDEVNAFYQSNQSDPTQPRMIYFLGDGTYAPSNDGGVVRHEYGHNLNERFNGAQGIDNSVEQGAVFAYGRVIHEAFADFWSESMNDKPYIGTWISHNFTGFAAGAPLRSAVDTNGQKLQFSAVAQTNGSTNLPDNYGVAEWLTRVLWDIRTTIEGQDSSSGPYWTQQLVISSLAKLHKDASITDFQNALLQTDSEMFCNFDQATINTAFSSRGFVTPPSESQPLTLTVASQAYSVNNGQAQAATMAAGANVVIGFEVKNPNAGTASNVVVTLTSSDPRFIVDTYAQTIGELAAGGDFKVDGNALSLDYALYGAISTSATAGSVIPYTVQVTGANIPTQTYNGQLHL